MTQVHRERLKKCAVYGLIPLVFYTACFLILTWPAILHFTDRIFGDRGDCLQNVWGIWWVHKALIDLHQSFWHTTYLHYPYGTSVITHTLSASNCLIALPLLSFLSLPETYNALIIFSFIASGMAMFFLAYRSISSYGGALLAGYIYTFCSYHFSHAQGHLQLVGMQYLPLVLLCIQEWLKTARWYWGLAGALSLIVCFYTDYYYFLFSVVAVLGMFLARGLRPLTLTHWRTGLVSLGIALAGIVPIAIAFIALNHHDPLLGFHDPASCSLDIASLIVPGSHWRWSSLTRDVWSCLAGNPVENDVSFGFGLIALLILAWRYRREIALPQAGYWASLLAIFCLFALGPVLHVGGKTFPNMLMPYGVLEWLIPGIKLGGCSVRMVVMGILSGSLLAGASAAYLWGQGKQRRLVVQICVALIVIEFWPRPLWLTPIEPPDYVRALQSLPGHEAAIDSVSSPTEMLYYQTFHEKPLALGYLARLPQSVHKKIFVILDLFRRGDFKALYDTYHFRYLVISNDQTQTIRTAGYPLLFEGEKASVFDLKPKSH